MAGARTALDFACSYFNHAPCTNYVYSFSATHLDALCLCSAPTTALTSWQRKLVSCVLAPAVDLYQASRMLSVEGSPSKNDEDSGGKDSHG